MAEDHISRKNAQRLQPDDDARRIDELVRETEEAIRNTKRFLEGIQESNAGAREHVGQIRERFEKDLTSLRRRQGQEGQI